MRVLVTGGAGYIGSVVTAELARAGHGPVVLDSLETGHRGALTAGVPLVVADLRDAGAVRAALREHRIEAVVHMAGYIQVGESVTAPGKYYRNNLAAGLGLLDAMVECGIGRMVFSSTAAVYGQPSGAPIAEDAPTGPGNPYGETKLSFERALAWYGRAHGIRSASLRYFNAAGATERLGEDHRPETHLIPLVLQAAAGRRAEVTVHGDDYPTPDGTCVRDYVHVADLARAHVLALPALGPSHRVYNVGCGGDGYSVRQVIEVARQVTGRHVPVKVGPRRPGDAPVLVARSDRIRRELGWSPERQDLRDIVASAWEWMRAHPEGYEDAG
ncbi:UDP-glucose 4-epimerase GalE [Myxococcota bacterium]|nr:UDP-glucose 4-epimerase GalE [Myxococcota bacterium]